jgi:small subunit ribosomal protein S19e
MDDQQAKEIIERINFKASISSIKPTVPQWTGDAIMSLNCNADRQPSWRTITRNIPQSHTSFFPQTAIINMAEEERGICVRDVAADAFITAYAEHLKNSDKFELPVWSDLVKTGTFKELAPYGDDWYYIRAASIARKVYLRPGLGVGALRKWYGGAFRNGVRAQHYKKANAGIIRSVLIQLETMKVCEPCSAGGRKMTRVGQQDLDRIANAVFNEAEE